MKEDSTQGLCELVCRCRNLADFKRQLSLVAGQFALDERVILRLGEPLDEWERNPRSPHDPLGPLLGYAVARAFLTEKVVQVCDGLDRKLLITLFERPTQLKEILRGVSREVISRIRRSLGPARDRLEELRIAVELTPKSRVKERFSGGLSSLMSTFHLLEGILGAAESDTDRRAGSK